MGGLGRPPPPRPTPPTPRQPRGPTRRQTQPSKAASPAALHADPRGPPAPSSAARAHPQGSRRHLVPPARRHFPPPPARRCASAPARPARPPAPARAGPGGRGSSVRGPPRRLGEGRAPTPPAAPGRRQPRPAKGPAGPHWAERLRRRPGPEGSIALTSCFGSGHFGRTRMEAPKNTRMEEAATGESGCSWGERAQPATGNGAAAAPRPRPPSNSPHSGPPLPGGGPARRARRHFRPRRRAGRFPCPSGSPRGRTPFSERAAASDARHPAAAGAVEEGLSSAGLCTACLRPRRRGPLAPGASEVERRQRGAPA